MKFNKSMLLLYAVTDRSWTGTQTLYEQIEDTLKGGATIVQLREKSLDTDTFVSEAIAVRDLCHRFGVPLIINDNLDVALRSRADGIHVGIDDIPVAEIRKETGPDFIIGATAKTLKQAQEAEKAGASYLGVGAVFPSPTKKNALRITNEQLHEICSSVNIPSVAIGGISLKNADGLKGSGVAGIAVVSAIFSSENIVKATASLKEKALAVTKL